MQDITEQLQKDFNLNVRDRLGEISRIEDYLTRHPEDRSFIQTFNFHSLFNQREYRERAATVVRNFLADLHLARDNIAEQNPYLIELHQNTNEERAYQDHLARQLKEAFFIIYYSDNLSRHLNQDENTGKELLKIIDGSIYIPLITYAQYQELLENIECPQHFTENLTRYNARHGKLTQAKQAVEALNQAQKEELEIKILKGADHNASADVQVVYLQISELAQDLSQGPLMTKTFIDLTAQNNELIVTQNLFQKACQEAVAEVENLSS